MVHQIHKLLEQLKLIPGQNMEVQKLLFSFIGWNSMHLVWFPCISCMEFRPPWSDFHPLAWKSDSSIPAWCGSEMSTNWVYNWHNILNCCPPFCFLQALATLLAFRFFPRAPWTLLPSRFFVPFCNSLPVFGWLQWVNAPTMVKYNTLTVSDNLIFWESLFGQRGKL